MGAGPDGVELAGQVRELASGACAATSARSTRQTVRVLLLDGGKEPLATFGDDLSTSGRTRARTARRRAAHGRTRHRRRRGGVDVADDAGTERIAARTVMWAAGVQASPLAAMLAEATGARGRPGRSHRGAARPHPAGASRGVRGRRHGDARTPPGRRRGRDAGRSARREHDRAPAAGRAGALPFRYRDLGSVATIGRFRAICSVGEAAPQWLPGLGRVDVRPPRVPQRVRATASRRCCAGCAGWSAAAGPSGCSASRTPAATSAAGRGARSRAAEPVPDRHGSGARHRALDAGRWWVFSSPTGVLAAAGDAHARFMPATIVATTVTR